MKQNAYSYKRLSYERYTFVSVGRNKIIKAVEFSPTIIKNLYNLGFGDLLPNGLIDDRVNSNNGDILKVLKTVVHIRKSHKRPRLGSPKVVIVRHTSEKETLFPEKLKMANEILANTKLLNP